MSKPALPPGFSWRGLRLFQAQQTLVENLNVPLRLLRRDALERLKGVLDSEAYSLLLQYVSMHPPEDILVEDVPPRLLESLCPKIKKDKEGKAEEEEKKRLLRRVSSAIWATERSAPNPFYDELKELIPGLRARVRLHLLRNLRSLNQPASGSVDPLAVRLPASLISMMLPVPRRGSEAPIPEVLVVGPSRLLPEANSPMYPTRFLKAENEVRELVSRRTRSTHEDQTNLLVLSSAYFSYSEGDLRHKAEAASRVLSRVNEIEDRYGESLNELSSAEWTKAVHFIFFWLSRRSLPLLDRATGPRQSFEVVGRISSTRRPGDPVWVIRLSGTRDENVKLHHEKLDFSLKEVEDQLPHERLSFCLDLQRQTETEEIFTYFYHRSLEDGHATRAWNEYMLFDRLRHRLQHLRVDDLIERQQAFTEIAREIVGADTAAYLDFHSLSDHLSVEKVSVAPWIEHTHVDKFKDWLRNAAKDPDERGRSSIYRCLDTRCYQSKLIVTPESHPFAVAWKEEFVHVPEDHKFWEIDPRDIIVVPVQFHDRMLGVLYLAAGTPNRFRYYDRIRLLSFVRMFEAEIFEAKLLRALRQMNEDLGSALRGNLTQKQFCDRLMQELGELLAVSGAVLWWRSATNPLFFEVLGFAGRELGGGRIIKHGLEEAVRSFPQQKITPDEPIPVLYQLTGKGLRFTEGSDWPLRETLGILLSDLEGRKTMGFITLHDSKPITDTDVLTEELRLVRDELAQNLMSLMEQHERLRATRDLIGHDVSSALKHIDGIRERLVSFQSMLPHDRQDGFGLRLQDLDRNVRRAQLLLDALTKESIQLQMIKSGANDTFSVLYQLLNEKLLSVVSLQEPINSALHGRSKDLRKRRIDLRIGGAYPPSMWVQPHAVEEVVGNLVDNVVKYGAPNRPLVIEYSEDSLEYFVQFDSWGYPLRRELQERPGSVLEMGVRGVEDRIARATPGTGRGLYSAREVAKVWDGKLSLKYIHEEPWARYVFTLSFPRWLSQRQNPWLPR